MRIGICIPHHRDIMPIDAVMEVPRRAEEAGFDSVWVNDHVVIPTEMLPQGYTPVYYDAFMVLANAAARTQRVKLGSTIIVLPYRHPLVQAKMLTTLDAVSGGRVIFGAGVGWVEAEFRALGIPFAERGARTDEALAIMHELWTSDAPAFTGRFYQFDGIQTGPKPVQQPRLPIWIGGSGRAALRRTAQYGDAWHPNARMGLDEIARLRPLLREQWQRFGRAGEPSITLRLACQFTPHALDGARTMGQGTVAQVVADLEQARALGIEDVVVDLVRVGNDAAERWNASFETFAREILPQFT